MPLFTCTVFRVSLLMTYLCVLGQCLVVKAILRPGDSQNRRVEVDVGNLDFEFDESSESPSSDSESEEGNGSKGHTKSPQLKRMGCYSSWRSQIPDYTTTSFFQKISLDQCASFCVNNNGFGDTDIYVLRGLFCGCIPWTTEGLVRVDEKYCRINCTNDDIGIDDQLPCGGNHVSSLYCNTADDRCTEFDPESIPVQDLEDFAKDDSDDSAESESSELIVPNLPCFNCTNHYNCYTSSFNVNLMYLPENTAESCIKFCATELQYFNMKDKKEDVRGKKKYANVGWTFRNGFKVTSCGCYDEPPPHIEIDPLQYCTKPCPLNPEQTCGGEPPFYFTLYKTNVDTEETFSTTEMMTTTPYFETTTEVSTVPVEMSTLVDTTIFETNLRGELSTVAIELTTKLLTTTAVPTMPPATVTVTSTKAPPGGQCSVKCVAKDKHGIEWTACADEIAWNPCPREAEGQATWKCSSAGSFIGETPDYSSCSTYWIKEKIEQIGDGQIHPINATLYLKSINKEVADEPGNKFNYFGHEIKEIMGIVTKIFHQLKPDADLPSFENLTDTAMGINENLLINAHPWNELPILNRTISGTDLLKLIEGNALNFTKRTNADGEYRKYFPTLVPGFKISAGSQPKSITNSTLRFPFDQELNDGSYILLPDGWSDTVGSQQQQLNFLGMAISPQIMKSILPLPLPESSEFVEFGVQGQSASITEEDGGKIMNGKLMTFTLAKEGTINFPGEGVKVRFRHDLEASFSRTKDLRRRRHFGESVKPVYGSSRCVYWDTLNLEWSSLGCQLVKSERSATLCECSHLTSFAVLMDMHNYVGKEAALEILTLIICPLSIICLFATIVIFTMVRSTHGVRTTITKNLCISLLIGNTLVLLIVDRHYLNMGEGVCAGSAILVHYVFLTAFMWTAIQGYHLYKQMVHVFESGNSHMTIYRVIAYGVPVLIVGTTAVVAYLRDAHAYGGEMFCWLQDDYIWSFMAPVAVICLANIVVLIVTLRAAYHVRSPVTKIQERVQNNRTWIKGCLSISILLGLTWITGFFMLTDSVGAVIAAYAFTVLNASQGIFLFIFHCLLNEKVRTAAARRNIVLPSWLSSTGTSPAESSQSRSKENPNIANPNMTRSRNRDVSKVQRRGGGGTGESQPNPHPPVGMITSIDSDNSTSNWSMKSTSASESTGSKINLLYSQRKPPWRK